MKTGKALRWWGFAPHCGSSVILTSRHGASSREPNNVWQLCKAMPSYFHRTKALSCQNRTHLEQKEASLSPTPPSTSPPQPHLPVVLVWQPNRDFFDFRFSAGGQSSPESEEMLPCFSPSLSFQSFPAESLSGMVRGAFHFSMRNDGSKLCDRTVHKGPRQHAIPQRLSKLLQLVISEICQVIFMDFSHTLPLLW